MKVDAKVEFNVTFAGANIGGKLGFKPGTNALHKFARTLGEKGWSNNFRDWFVKEWAARARKTILDQLRNQEFIHSPIAPLKEKTIKKKRRKNIDNGILLATKSILGNLWTKKTGTGAFVLDWRGMSSTPFGGKKIASSYLALTLERGYSYQVETDDSGYTVSMPARPFFVPGILRAKEQVVEMLGQIAVDSFLGAMVTESVQERKGATLSYMV